MEKENSKLIDITGYRKKNQLKQSELGVYFDTSASYVSLVETGNSKLSKKSLEFFWNYRGIDHTGLVPNYDRLFQLALTLGKLMLYQNAFLLEDKFTGDINYYEPFEELFTREAILSIKFGMMGISDDMAETLRASYTTKINKEWLIDGKGDMFIDDTPERILHRMDQYFEDISTKMSECDEKLSRIESKLDAVMKALNI